MKKYYKVVYSDDRGYTSAITSPLFVSDSTDELEVFYKVGEFVKPPSGANPFLFVFSTLESAISFRNLWENQREIFECEVTHPTYSRKSIKGYKLFAGDFPYGTMFVNSVKLIKRVV
jgi:hypothetical protein